MTARQILNIKPGQKVGLGNGLRVVCDKRNGLRFFELRKRVRGKDYSWGVGTADSQILLALTWRWPALASKPKRSLMQ